jgi:hypothetical protein
LHEDVEWGLPRHGAYELPLTNGPDINPDWTDALLFLTALCGDERVLQQIFLRSPAAIKFEERWSLRSQIPMPIVVWQWIEEVLKAGRNGSFTSGPLLLTRNALVVELEEMLATRLTLPDEFLAERVDVSLGEANSPEYPCAITRRTLLANAAPQHLLLDRSALNRDFKVRIAQMTAEPNWTELPERYPEFTRDEVNGVRKQFLRVFPATAEDGPEWDIAVFPEVFLPPSAIKSFERIVKQTGRAGLAGCLWREIPNAMERYSITPTSTYLANEALLVVPVGARPGRYFKKTRSFFVRKPLPTHVEEAFVRKLGEKREIPNGIHLLPGRRIYRFVHPKWGDFTVAICSDLIDAALWSSLRGQVLHLLSCAYNKDVNLFDALTWVRAYELCANVVATNCGEYGGSFAWSPQSGEEKETARIRGNKILVTADVTFPVKSLAIWQQNGIERSVVQNLAVWTPEAELPPRPPRPAPRQGPDADGEEPDPRRYKAPPPGFPGRVFGEDAPIG